MELGDADGKNLSKIREYLNHYENEESNEIPKPFPGPELKAILSEWDYNYIMPYIIEDTIDLLNAANVLDIKKLVDLANARLAL